MSKYFVYNLLTLTDKYIVVVVIRVLLKVNSSILYRQRQNYCDVLIKKILG